jgi:uracil-DNA glycosylase
MNTALCIDNLVNSISTDWGIVVRDIMKKHKREIETTINNDIFNGINIFPKAKDIMKAFDMFDVSQLKVVIIGQDSYHNMSKSEIPLASGLCFSVPNECHKCPPSLRVIFNELEHEYGCKRTNTDLTDWSKQGVLLLNCALTVQEGKPGSHMKIWKAFTNDVIEYIASNATNVVYILWGEFAKSFAANVQKERNLVLVCRHPSPLAQNKGPFIGNNHFVSTNQYLESVGKEPVKWLDI